MIGVRFKKNRKIEYFYCNEFINIGEEIIVETDKGLEFGTVEKNDIKENKDIDINLKKFVRIATEEDKKQNLKNNVYLKEALEICKNKIKKHELEMKIIDADLMFDCNKIIFYFTSDERIDFRDLVKNLAAIFKMRIELRQIGVRDEVKILNGIGICGRNLCCSSFLNSFQPVSIKMAKCQNLSLNTTKISGACGRLMCCLKYEEETYKNISDKLPKESDIIKTPDGQGIVLSVSVLREIVKAAVRIKGKDSEPIVKYYNINEIKIISSKKTKDDSYLDSEIKKLLD